MKLEVGMFANPPRNGKLTSFRPIGATKNNSKRSMITLKIRETFLRFSNNRTPNIKLKSKTSRTRNKGPI
jgi:hypothetical protein